MLYPLDDTIAAIASPPGGAARGIVRVSGPGVMAYVKQLFFDREDRPFSPGTCAGSSPPGINAGAKQCTLVSTGSVALRGIVAKLPCELYLWPTARSYTGQPVAEFHTLGSMPLLESLLDTLCTAGARLAQPGEFTLRAFLAGRLDLTRAEAVLGVIDAADGRQLDVALAQLAGGLAGPLGRLRGDLLDLLAHLEAGFDFADEDLSFIAPEELAERLRRASSDVVRIARQMHARQETTGLVRVVLAGRPNAGKSSLFNALADRSAALVSAMPGTTRDYLTAELDFDGIRCLLIDTAGICIPHAPREVTEGPPFLKRSELRDSQHPARHHAERDEYIAPQPGAISEIDRAAQAAAAQQSRQAEVRLLCIDNTQPLNTWEQNELSGDSGCCIPVLTKTDAPRKAEPVPQAAETSSVTGAGLDELRKRIGQAARAAVSSTSDVVPGTAARCRESLHLAAQSLRRARRLAPSGEEELIAAELRIALDALGKVVGAVYTDDVLDRIFSRFCVGK
jgi:tRNA modification GTPase